MIVIADELPLIPLLVIVLDDQRSVIPASLAAVEATGIAAGNCPDLCGVAYRAVQSFHNRYMSDIRDNNRVE